MLRAKHIDLICIAVMMLAVIATLLFMNGEAFGLTAASSAPGYEARLFDKTKVHTVDILMEDWDAFLETAARRSMPHVHWSLTERNFLMSACGPREITPAD